MDLGPLDLGVWMLTSTAPILLFWLFGALRGKSATVGLAFIAISATFGWGLMILIHAKGWAA